MKKNNKVIYTSLTGGYDQLIQPKCIFEGFDYICFSNDFKEKKVGIWEIRPIPFESKDRTRLSRFVKLNPHIALPEYEYSLWMDSNLCIQTDELLNRINYLIKINSLMASVLHPFHNCIYEDAIQCIIGGRDSYFTIKKQVLFLHSQKFPYRNGLYENNLIFRKHNDETIKKISNEWWNLYMNYSKRDQLSLCYVFWKNNFSPDLLLPEGVSTRNTECICYIKHKKRKLSVRLKSLLLRISNRILLRLFPFN